jgi:hypothetical protein
MNNYHFSKHEAKRHKTVDLFAVLLALIEVQRQATFYRNKLPSTLTSFGICGNVDEVLKLFDYRYISLSPLFFKDKSYPIMPYSVSGFSSTSEDEELRWGNTPTGDLRRAMLDHMIKDLTLYLTNDAIL